MVELKIELSKRNQTAILDIDNREQEEERNNCESKMNRTKSKEDCSDSNDIKKVV